MASLTAKQSALKATRSAVRAFGTRTRVAAPVPFVAARSAAAASATKPAAVEARRGLTVRCVVHLRVECSSG
jgi:hypothetical protein